MAKSKQWHKILCITPHRKKIHNHYARWREEQGIPRRCDMEECVFHRKPLIWNGKPLPLILDHIDGVHGNDTSTNLRYLCPNCNEQQITRGGRNRGRVESRAHGGYILKNPDGTKLAVSTANFKCVAGFQPAGEAVREDTE